MRTRPRGSSRPSPATELVGMRYAPPFRYADGPKAGDRAPRHRGDFVTLDRPAPGLVHIAPAFGEDDNIASASEKGLGFLQLREARRHDSQTRSPTSPGDSARRPTATSSATSRQRGLLFKRRGLPPRLPLLSAGGAMDDPLIQYARESWFIRTTQRDPPRHRQQPGRSTGSPSTSRTAASGSSSRATSTGRSRASASGAPRCRSGSTTRPAR